MRLCTPKDGPVPEFFFVPGYAAQRIKDDGALRAGMLADMRAFYAASNRFVTPTRLSGAEAVEVSWHGLLKGQVPPAEGLVPSW
jgi:hypothetical protein